MCKKIVRLIYPANIISCNTTKPDQFPDQVCANKQSLIYRLYIPPSAISSEPKMKAESSEAKNVMVFAISSA